MPVLVLAVNVCKNRIPNETLLVNCPQKFLFFAGKKWDFS
jgi:hypothetical protein